MDYSPLDDFLRVKTWHTTHAADDERFYRALSRIVDHPDFDPETMTEYMINRQKDQPGFGEAAMEAILRRQIAARYIHDFLLMRRQDAGIAKD